MRHGTSHGWLVMVVCLLIGTAEMACGIGLTISVAPTNIAWTSNTWVTLTVNGFSAGDSVKLGLYLDVAGNGVVDAADPLVAAYLVGDGRTNALGSPVIVDDEDGVTNGTVISRVAYFGQNGPLHVVGKYLWQARTVSGGASNKTGFSVTQETSTVWIEGAVIDAVSSNAVPGAVVQAECFSDFAMPPIWTGTNGAFRLYLPAGVSTSDVREISVTGLGYFNPRVGLTGTDPLSTYVFPNDLHAGVNPLPVALRVVPAIPGGVHPVSGHVYDDQTNALPGVSVRAGWSGGEDIEVMAITDTNGAYRLVVPGSDGAYDIGVDSSSAMYLGRIGVGQRMVVTQPMTGVDFYCPKATLLVRGRVLASDNGDPVVGATLSLGGDNFGCQGVSLTDGTFVVGAIAYTDYSAYEETMAGQRFVDAPGLWGLSITNDTCTNLSFQLDRGYPVAGMVFDLQTNVLSGGDVGAFRYPNYNTEWIYDAGVNRHGAYLLFAPTGAVVVAANGFPGFIGQTYAHHFDWEWDDNGVVADPVENTPAGTNGIDFYLPRAALIQGVVRGNHDPLPGMSVSVSERTGDNTSWRANGSTDESGHYSLEVLPGSNYVVDVWTGEGDSFWLSQYYSHASDSSSADPVTTDVDAPATNIDFDLDQGGIISGSVFEDDGETPVLWCWVSVENLDGSQAASGGTYDTGHFQITVPPGEYRVYAEGSRASFGIDMYYDGWLKSERDQANVVTAFVGQVTSNIDFVMEPGGTISGRVTAGDGTTPVAWCWVQAQLDHQGVGDGQTDEDGCYSFRVPPGTYVVAAYPEWNDQPFIRQYFSNAVSEADALPMTVESEGVCSNIDFQLQQGGTISGRVYADDDDAGVGGCYVQAEDYNTGASVNGVNSDSDGYFTLRLPAGQYRVRANPDQSAALIGEWYDDTVNYGDATPVDVADDNDTPGIDFGLALGFRVEGRVVDENGNPLAWRWLDAHALDEDENWLWAGGGSTDADGYYGFALPVGDSYFVRVPQQDGSWYPDTFFSNQLHYTQATMVQAEAGETIGNIDFQLTPGYTVWGHVYASDGTTPIPNGCVSGYGDDTLNYGSDWADENGAYSLVFPTNPIIVLRADASNYQGELYDQQYDPFAATFLQLSPYASLNADFALYGLTEDTDGDGVYDCDEDTVPDGVYDAADDDSSYLDSDTDDDGFSDGCEDVAGTNPKDPDSLLKLSETRQDGDGVKVSWDSVPGRAYEVYARDELPGAGDWDYLATITAEGTVTTFTNTAPPAHRFYRVRVQP